MGKYSSFDKAFENDEVCLNVDLLYVICSAIDPEEYIFFNDLSL